MRMHIVHNPTNGHGMIGDVETSSAPVGMEDEDHSSIVGAGNVYHVLEIVIRCIMCI
jgi:hypothetical protein